MKKLITFVLILTCILGTIGCGNRDNNIESEAIQTIDGNMKTYYENADGTWQADDCTYKYRLEIKGRIPNASTDTTFVYLSNLKNITFEQAWKASGLSSNAADYFDTKDAVLVEMKTE